MPALRLDPALARWAEVGAALVNTRPRPASPGEDLATAADLRGVLAGAPERPPRAPTRDDIPRARELRGRLFDAFSAGDRGGAAAALNPLLAAPDAAWGLRRGPDGEWRVAPGAQDDLVAWLGTRVARGLAELVALYGTERLHLCDADDCQHVLVDVSRNGARRFCSRTCASRVNVRRHRSRKNV